MDGTDEVPMKTPKKTSKAWGVIKLLAQFRFADAVEYANNGDTEN